MTLCHVRSSSRRDDETGFTNDQSSKIWVFWSAFAWIPSLTLKEGKRRDASSGPQQPENQEN